MALHASRERRSRHLHFPVPAGRSRIASVVDEARAYRGSKTDRVREARARNCIARASHPGAQVWEGMGRTVLGEMANKYFGWRYILRLPGDSILRVGNFLAEDHGVVACHRQVYGWSRIQ